MKTYEKHYFSYFKGLSFIAHESLPYFLHEQIHGLLSLYNNGDEAIAFNIYSDKRFKIIKI